MVAGRVSGIAGSRSGEKEGVGVGAVVVVGGWGGGGGRWGVRVTGSLAVTAGWSVWERGDKEGKIIEPSTTC